MNYSDYRFTLDVQIHQAQVSVPVTFGDTARRLCIGLTDGRKPYTIPEGCRAVFVAKKPDKESIINDCIIERNTIIYEFSQNTTSAEGVVNCEIRLIDTDERVLTSPQFIIVVDKNVMRDEEYPLSESESTTLSRIISSEEARNVAEDERQANEAERIERDEERDEIIGFFEDKGGIIISDEEPESNVASIWLKESPTEEEISLLTADDIAQELSNAEDKIPSVALVNRVAVDLEGRIDEKIGDIDFGSFATKTEVSEQLGDIDKALDAIIAIQNSLIGGDK